VRYSGIKLDTARYARIQLDTVGYTGIQWICCKIAIGYKSIQVQGSGIQHTAYSGIPTKDTVRYRQNTGGVSQKYTPGEGLYIATYGLMMKPYGRMS